HRQVRRQIADGRLKLGGPLSILIAVFHARFSRPFLRLKRRLLPPSLRDPCDAGGWGASHVLGSPPRRGRFKNCAHPNTIREEKCPEVQEKSNWSKCAADSGSSDLGVNQ